jgi:GDSL-like Lipase/Acylhydrolase family
MRAFLATCVAAVLLSASGALAAGPVGTGDNDRVVFYGDKLVAHPGFSAMVENFVRVRYPSSRARYWHVATRALETVEVANAQFDERVASIKPTVVVLGWGLGDGQMKKPNPARFATVTAGYEKLIDRCKALGAKVYVVTPPAPDVAKKNILSINRYDETIAGIAQAIASAAKSRGVDVLDWHGASLAMRSAQPGAELTVKDGLLPTALSQSIACKLIFDAWGFEPIDVTVDLDWSATTVSTTQGSASVAKMSDKVLRIDLSAFPMPFYTGGRKSRFADNMACADYCRMILRVSNFPGGTAVLRNPLSRAKPIRMSAADLNKGYNLAGARGPLRRIKAFKDLMDLVDSKNQRFAQSVLWKKRHLVDATPDPELVESYNTYLLSQQQYHEGLVKVIQRTPRVMEATLELSVAP